LKACTLFPKWRSPERFTSTSVMNGCLLAWRATISEVRSVEPSLTTIHCAGRIVCPIIDSIVCSMNCSSLCAGVTTTKLGFAGGWR
jgi:hypothetical protein